MATIESILKSKRRQKEKVTLLAEKVREDRKLVVQLVGCFEVGTVAEKEHCMQAMQYVSKDEPEVVLPHIDFVIDHFDDSGPRVKWEVAEIIHNVAQRFPEKVAKAVPKLLASIDDRNTVARWSVAHALTEIARNNLIAERTDPEIQGDRAERKESRCEKRLHQSTGIDRREKGVGIEKGQYSLWNL
jgi:hypothetical protein